MTRSTTERRLEFERLVRHAEALAARDPAAYRMRVAALAGLGYLVLFLLLAALAGLVGAGLWAASASAGFAVLLLKTKIALLLPLLGWIILRALFFRIPAPAGYPLLRADFPELFAELDRLRAALRTPAVDAVVLTGELNAAVAQTPRLGILGWHRSTLVLGLPLLLSLTPEQARAVLAHELAHLSGNHSRFAGWIYRVRIAWQTTMEALHRESSWGARLLARFFDWYAPYFGAYSFALARANEYEADALSARLATPRAAAGALVRTAVAGEIEGRLYWAPLIASSGRLPEPVADPFGGLARFAAGASPSLPDAAPALRRALALESSSTDTHPSLRDRLAALGESPEIPGPVHENAAQAWLGRRCAEVIDEFDRRWRAENEAAWRARYEEAFRQRAELRALGEIAEADRGRDEWMRIAALTERLAPEADVLPALRAALAANPGDAEAEFHAGRILAQRDDPACLAHLERATARHALAIAACEQAMAFLARSGDGTSAEQWRRRAEAIWDVESKARAERAGVSHRDSFDPPGLDAPALERLRARLLATGRLKAAWIARKRVEWLPEYPVHVIAVKAKGWFYREEKLLRRIAESVEGLGTVWVVRKGGTGSAIAKRAIGAGVRVL